MWVSVKSIHWLLLKDLLQCVAEFEFSHHNSHLDGRDSPCHISLVAAAMVVLTVAAVYKEEFSSFHWKQPPLTITDFLAFGDKITIKVSTPHILNPIGICKISHLTQFHFERHSFKKKEKNYTMLLYNMPSKSFHCEYYAKSERKNILSIHFNSFGLYSLSWIVAGGKKQQSALFTHLVTWLTQCVFKNETFLRNTFRTTFKRSTNFPCNVTVKFKKWILMMSETHIFAYSWKEQSRSHTSVYLYIFIIYTSMGESVKYFNISTFQNTFFTHMFHTLAR